MVCTTEKPESSKHFVYANDNNDDNNRSFLCVCVCVRLKAEKKPISSGMIFHLKRHFGALAKVKKNS